MATKSFMSGSFRFWCGTTLAGRATILNRTKGLCRATLVQCGELPPSRRRFDSIFPGIVSSEPRPSAKPRVSEDASRCVTRSQPERGCLHVSHVSTTDRAAGPRGGKASAGHVGRGARPYLRRLSAGGQPAWAARVWPLQLLKEHQRDELHRPEVRAERHRQQQL